MPLAMLRHTIVFALAAGAIVVEGLALAVPVDAQFTSWILVAVGVGVLCAVIARQPLGLLFVVAGVTVGILAIFAIKLGATATVSETTTAVGILYVEVLEVAALAYLLTAIVLARLRRER